MFKNYLITAYRNIKRQKLHSFINISGLAIGMACVILILLWIQYENSFDRFHEFADTIYKVTTIYQEENKVVHSAHTAAPLALALVNKEYPEVLRTVRFSGGGGEGDLVGYKNIQFRENLAYADSGFFHVFSFPLKSGNPSTALNERYSAVITEDIAEKYFGDEDPLGKQLQIYNRDFIVTGIIQNIPSNSRLQFDIIIPFHQFIRSMNWGVINYTTYIRIAEHADPDELEEKISGLMEKPPEGTERYEFRLLPIAGIHLFPILSHDQRSFLVLIEVLIFSAVGILILLIACINFVNMATARYSIRAREVGIRKVIGAHRHQLIGQFLGESFILTLLAFILAIVFAELLLPIINSLTGLALSFSIFNNLSFTLSLIFLIIITSILAGGYPAFFLSSFQPISIIRGELVFGKQISSANIRKILFILQFIISVFFIISLIVLHHQLHYMRTKNLGYDKDNLLILPIHKDSIQNKYKTYKTEILKHSDIINATATSFRPSEYTYSQNTWYEGLPHDRTEGFNWIAVDEDFVNTLGLQIIRGCDFSDHITGDIQSTYILNEAFVEKIQEKRQDWDHPVGKAFRINKTGPVIGVVNDFHVYSLRFPLVPLTLSIYPDGFSNLIIRINPKNIRRAIEFLENKWKEIYPGEVFEYSFLDEDFDSVYNLEIRLGRIFNYITGLALLTACLGLFGLVAFSAERRTKEIGIRKVLGASVWGIVVLISKEFLKWIVIANIIAWPIAYFALNKWLQNFAYRIDIGWWVFVLAGLLALVIALLTVSYQAIKAARANPVDELRYE